MVVTARLRAKRRFCSFPVLLIYVGSLVQTWKICFKALFIQCDCQQSADCKQTCQVCVIFDEWTANHIDKYY